MRRSQNFNIHLVNHETSAFNKQHTANYPALQRPSEVHSSWNTMLKTVFRVLNLGPKGNAPNYYSSDEDKKIKAVCFGRMGTRMTVFGFSLAHVLPYIIEEEELMTCTAAYHQGSRFWLDFWGTLMSSNFTCSQHVCCFLAVTSCSLSERQR